MLIFCLLGCRLSEYLYKHSVDCFGIDHDALQNDYQHALHYQVRNDRHVSGSVDHRGKHVGSEEVAHEAHAKSGDDLHDTSVSRFIAFFPEKFANLACSVEFDRLL